MERYELMGKLLKGDVEEQQVPDGFKQMVHELRTKVGEAYVAFATLESYPLGNGPEIDLLGRAYTLMEEVNDLVKIANDQIQSETVIQEGPKATKMEADLESMYDDIAPRAKWWGIEMSPDSTQMNLWSDDEGMSILIFQSGSLFDVWVDDETIVDSGSYDQALQAVLNIVKG